RGLGASVQPRAASGVGGGGAAAGEPPPPFVEGGGRALRRGRGRVMGNLSPAAPRVDALQAALDAVHAQSLFVGFFRRNGHDAAPDPRRAVALDLEQVEPLLGIGKIVARAKAAAGSAEVEARADLDEALGPGEALELDVRES